MKTIFLSLGLILICFPGSPVLAQSVDFDIHIGNRPAPPPQMVAGPPPIVLEAPPRMVYVDGLRAFVAMEISQDLFYYENAYYYHHNGFWYRSPYFRGPWVHTEGRGFPPGLYRHRIEEIREYKRHAWEDHRERETRFRERHFQAEEHQERHGREMR